MGSRPAPTPTNEPGSALRNPRGPRELIKDNATTVAAAVAGVVSIVAGFPFDSVKTRMQTQPYGTMAQCFRDTVAREGVRGLFRGLLAPLVSITTGRVISFSVYHDTRDVLLQSDSSDAAAGLGSQVFASVAAGCVAGTAVTVVGAPLELVKIQRQLQELLARQQRLPESTRQRVSTLATAAAIYRHAGARGLYYGVSVHLVREMIGTPIYYTGYAMVKRAILGADVVDHGAPVHELYRQLAYMTAGAASGVLSWVACFPIDLAKSTLQQQVLLAPADRAFPTARACFRHVWLTRGPLGLYRGFSATLARAIPVHALTWIIFEQVRQFCVGL